MRKNVQARNAEKCTGGRNLRPTNPHAVFVYYPPSQTPNLVRVGWSADMKAARELRGADLEPGSEAGEALSDAEARVVACEVAMRDQSRMAER